MTDDDKLLLMHFVTRTGMYINPVDINNIQSFITGYETGRKNECNFYEISKSLLSKKYKIKYLSDGWAGQIKRLSKELSLADIVVFKKIALETIAKDRLNEETETILKSRLIELINRIDKAGHPCYNETWKEDWISLTSINNNWFKQLWTTRQLSIIKAINIEVLNDTIFDDDNRKIPSDLMIKLKDKFDQINCT